jgi:tetratricopeptide (TPR) repeat protein
MWDLAVREGDYARADSLVHRKWREIPLYIRAVDAFARGDSAARQRILREASRSDPALVLASARLIALYLEDVATAEQLARFATAPGQKPASRAAGHRLLAVLELTQGRWSAAAAEFVSAERLGGAESAREGRAVGATVPFLAVPKQDLVAIRADVEQRVPGLEGPETRPGLAAALRPERGRYVLGLLASRLGADADALRYATELEGTQAPGDAGTVIRDWAHTVRADLAARRGRLAEAVEALDSVRGEIPLELVGQNFYAEEHTRYLRAELFYQVGRTAEARRWFEAWLEASYQGTLNELVYLAPFHFRLGEIYQGAGDRAKAADHYSRFINLWKNCDPELRPKLEEAKSRLAAVVREPVRP